MGGSGVSALTCLSTDNPKARRIPTGLYDSNPAPAKVESPPEAPPGCRAIPAYSGELTPGTQSWGRPRKQPRGPGDESQGTGLASATPPGRAV